LAKRGGLAGTPDPANPLAHLRPAPGGGQIGLKGAFGRDWIAAHLFLCERHHDAIVFSRFGRDHDIARPEVHDHLSHRRDRVCVPVLPATGEPDDE